MPWSSLQASLRRISTPIRLLISFYALLVACFTLLRLLRLSGAPLLDLANTFAPYWFMPLVVTFPLSIIVTRGGASGSERSRKRLSRLSKSPQAESAPLDPPRWSVLLQICLIALGLYWFAIPGMYFEVEPPAGDSFSVVTFNVQGSNQELQSATDWLLQTAPDLIVLQETAEGYDPRLAPLYDVYAHEDHIEGSVRVFSRYAILERDILIIEDEPGREALRLLLNQDGRELAVYALHFTLPLKPRPQFDPNADIGPEALLRYDERRRNAQIRRFLEYMRAESKPFIVAGDFNTSDASLIYDELAERMGDAWRAAGVGAGRTWPVAEAIGLPRVIQPLLRIDYIWHSADLRPVEARVGEPIGSDHLPVTVEFEWRQRYVSARERYLWRSVFARPERSALQGLSGIDKISTKHAADRPRSVHMNEGCRGDLLGRPLDYSKRAPSRGRYGTARRHSRSIAPTASMLTEGKCAPDSFYSHYQTSLTAFALSGRDFRPAAFQHILKSWTCGCNSFPL